MSLCGNCSPMCCDQRQTDRQVFTMSYHLYRNTVLNESNSGMYSSGADGSLHRSRSEASEDCVGQERSGLPEQVAHRHSSTMLSP